MPQRLFFDVDGVLLNFEHAFVDWINRLFGLGLPADYETEDWYFQDVLSKEECRAAWDEFLGSDAAARMRPYLEPERLNALTGDRPVHLLTNFPEHHFDKRIANLDALGIRYDSLHYCGFHAFKKGQGVASKSQMIDRLLGDGEQGLFVDDHPENCLDVAANCPNVEVWLMSRRFNRDFAHPAVRRAADWGSMIERLDGAGGREPRPAANDAEAPAPAIPGRPGGGAPLP